MSPDASRVARVPPGRHELSREFIAKHQRERIIRAFAEVVSEQGYQAVTVGDIVQRAKIARNTFYEHFASKQDCFLAAFDLAAADLFDRVATSSSSDEDFAARVRAGLGAFLDFVAAEPALAHICIVDVLTAGPEAMDRFEQALQRFAPLLREGRELRPTGAALPETIEETVLGGLVWIVYRRLAAGSPEEVQDFLPELLEFALTPYLGPAEAHEVAAAQAPS
jgi:AcrR family transcriptional regulator